MFVLMPDSAPAHIDHELQLLGAMVECAHALGMRFGEAAQAEPDVTKSVPLFDAFNRSFLAVRMGIRLSLTLRAPPKPARAEAVEREALETEAPERDDRAEPLERDRDRD